MQIILLHSESWLRYSIDLDCVIKHCGSTNLTKSGQINYFGIETEPNFEIAVRYLRQAASSGDSEACYLLGLCYEEGRGVKKDVSEALAWYHKSSDPRAVNMVGALLKDQEKAFPYYQKAADLGAPHVLLCCVYFSHHHLLSCMHHKCLSLLEGKKAIVVSLTYLVGDLHGMVNLGFAYQSGIGTKKSDTKAFELYMRAAQKGLARAQ
jgi:hypothetical protein